MPLGEIIQHAKSTKYINREQELKKLGTNKILSVHSNYFNNCKLLEEKYKIQDSDYSLKNLFIAAILFLFPLILSSVRSYVHLSTLKSISLRSVRDHWSIALFSFNLC